MLLFEKYFKEFFMKRYYQALILYFSILLSYQAIGNAKKPNSNPINPNDCARVEVSFCQGGANIGQLFTPDGTSVYSTFFNDCDSHVEFAYQESRGDGVYVVETLGLNGHTQAVKYGLCVKNYSVRYD